MSTNTRRDVLKGAGAGLALAVLPAGGVRQSVAQVTTRLSIATGGTGGVYYPLGGGIAALLSKHVPGVEATAEATAAAVDNLKLLHTDRVALGISGADVASEAYAGQLRGLPEKVEIRTIASIFANFMHIVTLEDSGIRSVADFKGRRVSTGAAGSATDVKAVRILEAYGLSPNDLRSRDRLSVVEQANALRDKKIDAFFWNSGIPTGTIIDLALTSGVKMRLLPHGDVVAKIAQKYGQYYFAGTIPKGTYKGIDADVPVLAETHALVAHARMPEALAYKITATLLEHIPDLVTVHSAASELSLENAVKGSAVPFHPGAARYYKEKGVAVPG